MGLGAVGEQQELVWEPPRIRFEHARICLGARKKKELEVPAAAIRSDWSGAARRSQGRANRNPHGT